MVVFPYGIYAIVGHPKVLLKSPSLRVCCSDGRVSARRWKNRNFASVIPVIFDSRPKFDAADRPSRLDPFADRLAHMLRQEAGRSRKQKRTVKQLHADLVALGYSALTHTTAWRLSRASGRRRGIASSKLPVAARSCRWRSCPARRSSSTG